VGQVVFSGEVIMPEGPEVSTIVDGLNRLTKDRWITSIVAIGGRYDKKAIPGLTDEFLKSSHPISSIRRHGKAVVFELMSGKSVVVTLGMTGKFSLTKEKHTAVEFTYGDAVDKLKFYFVDQRRFGTVRIIDSKDVAKILPKLGWDALSEEIDIPRVTKSIRNLKKGTPIGSALLDGQTFSGIGNYLRAEILYSAKISPWRKCEDLSDEDIARICESSRRISLRSYELGGNTIENYAALDGGTGKFFDELKVYAKRKDPDGNEVIAEKTPEGRTIHWVPTAQS
jgi:DNA-formamidopyrimidine glycosylase